MPFEGEPPNGDYAGYIDRVINKGTGTPGEQRLLKGGSGGVRARMGIPGLQKGTLGPGEQRSTGTGMPSAPVAPVATSIGLPPGVSEPASTTTLAAQRTNVGQGLVQTVLGGLFGLAAAGSLVSTLMDDQGVQPYNVVQILVPAVIARFLLKRGVGKMRGGQPLQTFPPLAVPRGDLREAQRQDRDDEAAKLAKAKAAKAATPPGSRHVRA
jgi:hypothetical protein